MRALESSPSTSLLSLRDKMTSVQLSSTDSGLGSSRSNPPILNSVEKPKNGSTEKNSKNDHLPRLSLSLSLPRSAVSREIVLGVAYLSHICKQKSAMGNSFTYLGDVHVTSARFSDFLVPHSAHLVTVTRLINTLI